MLTSSDGVSVELRPTRNQFPAAPGEPGGRDANRLEIHGRVRTVAGESWKFDDPCLTTWEAREIGDWLRAAADGRIPVIEAPTEDSEELLTFTEPNLGLSVGAGEGDSLLVRVHLSLESVAARPGTGEEAPFDFYARQPVHGARSAGADPPMPLQLHVTAGDPLDPPAPTPARRCGESVVEARVVHRVDRERRVP